MSEALGFDEAEKLLLESEFVECRETWYSSNYVFLARLRAEGDSEAFAAVYKPARGESPLWDFPEGRLYQREAAAYRLARLLGWDIVPPTIIRDGPHGVGSLQVYVAHNPEEHFFVQRERPELIWQLQRIALFDVIANNADRKGGHCLLDAEGRIWGIDHGLCFHREYKLRSVIWDWAGEPFDSDLAADLQAALDALETQTPAACELLTLLAPGEAAALTGRIERVLREGRLPFPGPNRHYPWPLV